MKKNILFFLLLAGVSIVHAQENVSPTDSFTVTGDIKKPVTFYFNRLDTFKSKSLNDVTTLNHMGQVRSVIKNVKGVLLKDVLNSIELIAPKPKDLSSYYIECIATDGYKVIFSRNEIFNTANGDNTYIITEKDGKKGKDIDDRIAILIMFSPGRGHAYMKGVKEVVFKTVK